MLGRSILSMSTAVIFLRPLVERFVYGSFLTGSTRSAINKKLRYRLVRAGDI